VIRLVTLALAAALAACVQPQQAQNAASTDASPDTVRGTVRVVGSEPGTWVVLHPEGEHSMSVAGHAAEQMRAVSGADVWARGRATGGGRYFEVEEFAVRSADGRATWDGVVTRTNGGLSLALTEGGTVELRNPPQALYAVIGSRIWITQSIPDRGDTWGVIPAR
jgi:hypothetical protein